MDLHFLLKDVKAGAVRLYSLGYIFSLSLKPALLQN